MVLGTYVNLYEADTKSAAKPSEVFGQPAMAPRNADRPDHVDEDVKIEAPDVHGQQPAYQKIVAENGKEKC